MAAAGNDKLDITFSKADKITLLVKVAGGVIDSNVKLLRDKLERAYQKNAPRIVLDVSGITFLNSQGLGVIIYIHTLMHKSERTLLILNDKNKPSTYLDDLFEMSNLNKVLNIAQQL